MHGNHVLSEELYGFSSSETPAFESMVQYIFREIAGPCASYWHNPPHVHSGLHIPGQRLVYLLN